MAYSTTSTHTHSNLTLLEQITAAYTVEEQTKLSGVQAGATANESDTSLKTRYNHLGPIGKVLFALTGQYPTIQSAIDAAELMTESDTPPGVTVSVPAGSIREDVLIRKNVNLVGHGPGVTVVKSVTIRPTSDTIAPQRIALVGMTFGDSSGAPCVIVDNETSAGSGVFSNSMFQDSISPETLEAGLHIVNCDLTMDLNYTGGNYLYLRDSKLGYVNITNAYVCYCMGGMISAVNVISDSTTGTPASILATDPTTYVVNISSLVSQVNLTSGGTLRAAFENHSGEVSMVQANQDTNVTFYGGTLQNLVLNGTGQSVGLFAYTPYSPTVPTDWNSSPTTVGLALDELASRLKLIGG